MVDWMIAGAGLAGSVVARKLADAGYSVLVVEREKRVGGTAYDEYDDHGVLVQRHGGHIFHSGSEEVVNFLSRFTSWRMYEHRVLASVEGQLVPLPINLDTVNRLYGLELSREEVVDWFRDRAVPLIGGKVRNAEEAVTSKVGMELFNLLYANYSAKQWGCDLRDLGPQVTNRIPIRTNRDDRYFSDRYQMIPSQGYTRLITAMLDHPGISLLMGVDARMVRHQIGPQLGMVWTGPIDHFFDCQLGVLPYRSMEFTYESFPSRDLVQPVATVNYPNDSPFVRSTEFRHITGQVHDWTTLVWERPTADGPPFYPVPSPATEEVLKAYKDLARREEPSVSFTGRLGSYRYYNMDQVIAQSLTLAKRLDEEKLQVAYHV